MHGSVWQFHGDPENLARQYEAIAVQMPAEVMVLHACLRTPDGLLVVDTCPSREVFEQSAPRLREGMAAVGLPEPTVQDYPVQAAFAAGQRVA